MFEKLDADAADLAAVESELVTLAGHLAATTCRFLHLLAEFDARRGWAGPGLRSCAHWLNWRVGLSLRTARDHLRVAHALRALPETTAAFAAGRVSYSKVRALTRIATPTTEHDLLAVALSGTASQLDDLVRAARSCRDPRPAAARRAAQLHPGRRVDAGPAADLRRAGRATAVRDRGPPRPGGVGRFSGTVRACCGGRRHEGGQHGGRRHAGR